MKQEYIKIVNTIYRTMKDNIDIIEYWFEKDNKKLEEEKLFKYTKEDFTIVLESEEDIYSFINKLINNILSGKDFQTKNLNYLEANFVSLVNAVIEDYKDTLRG